jgi:hypothetical protein
MPMGKEPDGISAPGVFSREPKGPVHAGDKGSPGDQALMDAVFILAACWVILFLLIFSVRRYTP